MLAVVLVTSLLCFIALYAGKDFLFSDTEIPTIKIAVVTEDEDNSLLGMAKDLFDNMLGAASNLFITSDNDYEGGSKIVNTLAGTSDFVIFEIMPEDEALRKIRSDDVSIIIYLGMDEVTGLMRLDNVPIKLVYKDYSDLLPLIFRELIDSASSLLSTAQSATLTTTYYYVMAEQTGTLNSAFNHIDMVNYTYTLYRNSIFERESVGFGGSEATVNFYIGTILTFILLIVVSTFAPALSTYDLTLRNIFRSKGMGNVKLTITRFLAFTVFQFILIGIITCIASVISEKYLTDIINSSFLAGILNINISFTGSLLIVLLISVLLSAYTIFIISLTRQSEESILFFFIFAVILMLISGCFIPQAFFPDSLKVFSSYMPAWHLHKMMLSLLTGSTIKGSVSYIVPTLVYTVIFVVLTILINLIKDERKSRNEK